jgi:DNA-binding response OmpR family regulator
MNRQDSFRLKIVAVDDEPDFLSILREYLAPEHDILCLNSGESLLEELDDIEPDALIMDVRMPGQDGFSLCHKIRAQKRFTSLPIVFLTSCQQDADFAESLRVGGTAYLAKPITRKQLTSALREILWQSAPAR